MNIKLTQKARTIQVRTREGGPITSINIPVSMYTVNDIKQCGMDFNPQIGAIVVVFDGVQVIKDNIDTIEICGSITNFQYDFFNALREEELPLDDAIQLQIDKIGELNASEIAELSKSEKKSKKSSKNPISDFIDDDDENTEEVIISEETRKGIKIVFCGKVELEDKFDKKRNYLSR